MKSQQMTNLPQIELFITGLKVLVYVELSLVIIMSLWNSQLLLDTAAALIQTHL